MIMIPALAQSRGGRAAGELCDLAGLIPGLGRPSLSRKFGGTTIILRIEFLTAVDWVVYVDNCGQRERKKGRSAGRI